jgi:hypothetical protein
MNFNKCIFFCIYLREKYLNIIKKKILLIEKNNKLIDNNLIIFSINRLYNFNLKHLLKYYNYNIVYELDNLIFYDENIINKLTIQSIIINVSHSNDESENNITETIKKYSLNIPIYIIVKLEKFNIKSFLIFKFLSKGGTITKKYKINDILNKRLCELVS